MTAAHSSLKKLGLPALALSALLAAGCSIDTSSGFDHKRVLTHTVDGQIHEIVVQSGRGDVDLVPAGKAVQVRETQHYDSGDPRSTAMSATVC